MPLCRRGAAAGAPDGVVSVLCIGSMWRSWGLLRRGFERGAACTRCGFAFRLVQLHGELDAALGAAALGAYRCHGIVLDIGSDLDCSDAKDKPVPGPGVDVAGAKDEQGKRSARVQVRTLFDSTVRYDRQGAVTRVAPSACHSRARRAALCAVAVAAAAALFISIGIRPRLPVRAREHLKA